MTALDGAWELDPQVALRPEPFGALAYHYGNRRLTFLRSPELVALVRSLRDHDSVDGALAATGVDPRRWPAFRRALATLAEGGMLRRREPGEGAQPGPAEAVA